jgi:hypothetical protein
MPTEQTTTSHEAGSFGVQRAMLRAHAHYGADGVAYYGVRGERLASLIEDSWLNEARVLILDLGVAMANLPPQQARLLRIEAEEVTRAACSTGEVPAVAGSNGQDNGTRVSLDAAAALAAERPEGEELTDQLARADTDTEPTCDPSADAAP